MNNFNNSFSNSFTSSSSINSSNSTFDSINIANGNFGYIGSGTIGPINTHNSCNTSTSSYNPANISNSTFDSINIDSYQNKEYYDCNWSSASKIEKIVGIIFIIVGLSILMSKEIIAIISAIKSMLI